MDRQLYIEKYLESRRKQWPEIARLAGISLRTLYSLAKNEHVPITSTVNRVYDAMMQIKPPRKSKAKS